MNCESCGNTIDQGRIDWCRQKGFSCKYCKDCSQKKKAAKAQNFQQPSTKSPEDEAKWEKIALGKIAHGFLVEAYKLGKDLRTAKNEAYLWTKGELEVQSLIANERKLV